MPGPHAGRTRCAPYATLAAVLDFDRVEARDLVKLYGSTRALVSVSVVLRAGEITAIEGANGSGKSTLLSLLALQARPTRGELRFGDKAASDSPELRGAIGLLAHAALLYPDLSGLENLELCAALHGLAGQAGAARIAALRERFELGPFVERAVRTYSRGQLQRVALARAILHAPRLLLLDEPSTGLDATGVERLIEVMRAERERGAIVVLVTHDAGLAEAVADRRLRLVAGRVESVQ
jgi:ABC-type multidrug transport system ATPase subunit